MDYIVTPNGHEWGSGGVGGTVEIILSVTKSKFVKLILLVELFVTNVGSTSFN